MVVRPKPGVHERILLHLSDFSDFMSSVEVPFALSQMGIANAVSIARSNVPRAISGLKDQGFLVERQAHVQGVSRKRKAYFLTDSGMNVAEETWKRLREFPLRAILPDGTTITSTLGEIQDKIPFTMRPVDVIRYLNDNGVLDVRSLSADLVERDLSKHVEKQLVTSLGDLPRLRHFYGRSTELENMVNLLEARSTTLMIPGIAGIGKTSMAAKVIESFMHRRNLLYHRCQDWDGSRAFFESIADWLSSIGDPMLADYISATPVPQAVDAARIITDALSGSSALIVIDDYHKVNDKVLHQTIQAISRDLVEFEGDVGLVIFSRSFRQVVPLKDADGRIVSLVLPLEGLDQESTRSLLSAFDDLDQEKLLYIHSLSRGHPLVLELINRGASAGAFHESLENYVNIEIFSKLSGEQKRLLGALSIFREPIPLEAITEQGLNIDELDSLVESGLARHADSDAYDVHDLIREFLLQSLDEQSKEELHNKAVSWYQKQSAGSHISLELIYHLIASSRHEEATQIVIEQGRNLIKEGHIELLGLLESIDTNSIVAESSCRIDRIRGEVLSLLGRFDEAEEAFSKARPPAEAAGLKDVIADILSNLADIALKRGDSNSSLSMHRKSLELYIEIGDAVGAARSYNNMGYILRRSGDKVKALEAYSEVESILASDDSLSLISAEIVLARSLLDLGEHTRARDHALSAYERSESSDDPILHARARAVLGRYYAKSGDADLALHHYTDALATMGEAGDPLALVEVSILLGEVLQDSGKIEEALERYREALIISEANDLRMQIGELLARLGGVAPDRQRRTEYLQRALSVFRELGAQTRMREVQMMVHTAVMGR
ncbi:MAG: tetratricopeptide repeat protein [Euryarchaeota archaeon]|nr:tetratricopeptide repeat protein [Euryarchaeota archaeon]MBT4982232.1 tetratricopeptide repeat protein [Euryarchaeota archaeon]MBT5183744.1 tetratricopeptide repeat protein [Euryarchaeota archaeon]